MTGLSRTAIEWADYVWSPIAGCKNGCSYCYARRIATTRLAHLCPKCATFEPHLHRERLDQPFHSRRKPGVVFADSMSDWWSDGVPQEWRSALITAWMWPEHMAHKFVLLTKRPERITEADTIWMRDNLWLGVSITSGADWWRWEALAALKTNAHKFISVEPLLGDGVADALARDDANGHPSPEWVIVGPQSGPVAQAVSRKWQADIREVCNMNESYPPAMEDIPLFEKANKRNPLPIQPLIRQMPPDLAAVYRKTDEMKRIGRCELVRW